ncbi:MAG: NAD(P)/FAD-dependent oxidoreductase [Planctomycetota bacterium]|jgi:protoporphyrinogen oxidase
MDGVHIIGAGPAGLTAAYELTKQGRAVTVLEGDPEYVGGISRTVRWRDYRFDIGGHRFFSKNEEVEALWREILPDAFIEVPRLSRIFYDGKFFDYPLKPANALRNLGVLRSASCVLSYLYRNIRPIRPEASFKDWITNRFGDRLFATFFESYTEKVWGMKCEEISADWAAQRIKGLSLSKAVLNSLRGGSNIKTLIDRFRYPRLGPGQMWEVCAERVRATGSTVAMDRTVTRLERGECGIERIVCGDAEGGTHSYDCTHVISSMPLRELVEAFDPAAPDHVLAAARSLRYRDFLTVALVVREKECFPDNWVYIHDPDVKVGRIQNFRNWSAAMVPGEVSVLGLEYFCFEGDQLWESDGLVELGRKELAQIGLAKADRIGDGTVVRMPKAYPIYDEGYKQAVATIRDWLRAEVPNTAPAGRNGMHKYNNQDHSMMAALMSARNLLGTDLRDPWMINTDAEYHEEVSERAVPEKL